MAPSAVHPLRAEDAGAAHALLAAQLGRSLYTEALLRALAQDPGAVLLGCRDGGDLLGVGLGEQVPLDRCERLYRPFGNQVPVQLALRRLGTITALAVAPRARGQGAGRALIEELVAGLLRLGCNYLTAVAWVPPDPAHTGSAPILERAGFLVLGESTMAALSPGRRCPACGEGCRCPARLYGRSADAGALLRWREAGRRRTG